MSIPQKGSEPSQLSAGLKLVRECPTCSQAYEKEDARVVEEHDQSAYVLHFTCASCKSMILACITLSPFGAGSVAMLTDLDPSDVPRLANAEPLSEDDVLAIHALLKKNSIMHGV